MKDIWNKIKENKKTSITIAVLVVVLIVLLVLVNWGSRGISENQEATLSDSQIVSELIKKLNEGQSLTKEADLVEANSFVEVVNGLSYYKKVQVPLLANPKLFDNNDNLKIAGCGDQIVWTTINIEPTRAPLMAAIRALLDSDINAGFEPGNFLGSQEKLSLKEVIIENKLAKVYLEGEFTTKNDCDKSRRFIQLEEVANQFDTVDKVEIYLNNELVK